MSREAMKGHGEAANQETHMRPMDLMRDPKDKLLHLERLFACAGMLPTR